VVAAGEWDVEFYADEDGREPCRSWANNLSPQKRAAFAAAIRLVLARRGLDVVETEFGKALGGGARRSNRCKTNARARRGVGGGRV
jgi:hypothetical protein